MHSYGSLFPWPFYTLRTVLDYYKIPIGLTGNTSTLNRLGFHSIALVQMVCRIALNVAVVAFTVVVGIFFYLAVWLQYMKKVTVPWDIYCPNMIPTATGASVVCFISLIVTFWPSWGFLSPLFVGALTIGGIFSTAFIPWPC